MSDARKKSSEMVQSAAEDSVAMTQKILDEARDGAQAEADSVKAEGSKEVSSIQKNSSANQDKAVQMVVNGLTSE
jgi:vacuolar-type H+-ATPase subunit H